MVHNLTGWTRTKALDLTLLKSISLFYILLVFKIVSIVCNCFFRLYLDSIYALERLSIWSHMMLWVSEAASWGEVYTLSAWYIILYCIIFTYTYKTILSCHACIIRLNFPLLMAAINTIRSLLFFLFLYIYLRGFVAT